jgi:hypothetical protein
VEENLVFAGFCAVSLAAMFGLYLFFGKYRQHESKKLRWAKILLGNLLVFVFVGSLVVLLGEVYFRFCYDTTDSFTLTKTSARWFKRYYRLNNVGVRDNQDYISLAPAPGQRRVTFIGDSFTVGHGLRNVDDRFANRIRHQHPEWEVHVMAKLGLDSGAELRLMKQLVEGNYEFDQVVLVYCLNDIDDVTPEWNERYAKINKRLRRQRPSFLFEHSFLLNTIYYRMWMFAFPEISDYYRCDREAYAGAPWEAHTPRLKAMRDLVRSHGGQLSVVTFPFLHLIGPNYEFRAVHRQLNDFWRSIEVQHLDLLPVLAPYPPRKLTVNRYDAHPNEFANALAADSIARFLEEQIRLRRSGAGSADQTVSLPPGN